MRYDGMSLTLAHNEKAKDLINTPGNPPCGTINFPRRKLNVTG